MFDGCVASCGPAKSRSRWCRCSRCRVFASTEFFLLAAPRTGELSDPCTCDVAYMPHLDIPAMHRIGARRFPASRCDAWVGYDGAPILDQCAKVSDYTLIAAT